MKRLPFGPAAELRAAYEAVDWASTPLGEPSGWPPVLRRALELALETRFAVLLCWGPELTMVYNQAYGEVIGSKHPAALGRPVSEVFPEAWDELGPLFASALAGDAVWFADLPVMLERDGFLAETFFTFSYSPVRDQDGSIAGVMDIAVETTRQVQDHRRLELLTRLGDLATELQPPLELAKRALDVLSTASADLPAVDLQLPGGESFLPPPPAELKPRQVLVREDGAGSRLAWVRIPAALGGDSPGVMVARLSDVVAVDATYLDFLRLVAATVGDALSAAASFEAERRRADLQEWQAQRLAGLVAVAQALPDAEEESDVLHVLARGAVGLLGSDGIVLGVVEDRVLRVLGDEADPAAALLPRALRGAPVREGDGTATSAAWPLRLTDRVIGALGLSWRGERELTSEDTDLLNALAASTAQALDRVRALRAERQAAAAVRSLAETLQRSLLTSAPQPEHLDIAVRYLPAAEHAQVGGDWHDAFLTASGTACLVIGDVTGHDQDAAAAMGQVRNLLRGIGYSLEVSPAAALAALDRAMRDLGVGALATGVLATVEPLEGSSAWRLRWSNAGHPPPLVVSPDGSVELLRTSPDLLLGLEAGFVRADHVHGLPPGATVLLYTDGLIERRGASLDEGLAWLAGTVAGFAGLSPAELCDEVLQLVAGHAEDDVAVLAVRVRPEPTPVVLAAS
ncbi:serine phosphatase RsbU (regulator of sigma subunit) [Kineococcus radiotolerans]|uniref:Serine phosphatase RsbU (Regulator of sigma subunit) n=1 Tax=Kineococcus radiotolerans TaxID=131568 RepID=A0A7W4XWY7_KINRA|nr:SpoIIE family protein phosphatase [Kineococcus radiotolerans]MBB2901413.1 serine phosphatase RsbU (regulator of sigma subunit) [Kineococcus radiotolerans]